MFLTIFLAATFVPLLLFYNFYWKRRNFPPGPAPLPLLGNTRTIARYSPGYEAFQMWAVQFGPVYTIWIGEIPTVIVTDYQLLEKTFVKDGDAYAGREFLTEAVKYLRATKGEVEGVTKTEGEQTQQLRRFIIHSFRELGGMGGTEGEKKVLVEVECLVERINKQIEEGVQEHNLTPMLELAVGSILNQFLLGYRFTGEHSREFHHLKKLIDDQSKLMSSVTCQMVLVMPWLRHLPLFKSDFESFNHFTDQFYTFFDRHIDNQVGLREARKTQLADISTNEKTPSDCFVQQFLSRMEEPQPNAQYQDYLTMEALRGCCYDLFIAGQETTSAAMEFMVLYLLLDQRVQSKLQQELDDVIGGAHLQITGADKHKLPYTQAVVNEVLRMANLLPHNLQHRTTREVNINGHKISKGTTIVPQISTVLLDEKIFPHPHQFLPERFIDEHGRLKKCKEMIAFSVGKRKCLAEQLARMELFMVTANLFNKFKILPVNPLDPPSVEKVGGFTVSTQHFNCRILKR